MIICDKKMLYYKPVMWVFQLIKRAYQIDLISNNQYQIKVGHSDDCDIHLDVHFYEDLFKKKIFKSDHHFHAPNPNISLHNGKIDYISTIFYLVNCVQEYGANGNQLDKYGRFSVERSLQKKYDILEIDHVKLLITQLLKSISPALSLPQKKSRIFVSHDIDSVYGSLNYDGLAALKKGDIGQMLRVIKDTVVSNPAWFNIDKVAKLENEYDIKACYYWIVSNGRSSEGIKNGDYTINDDKIKEQKAYVESLGNECGLHKSTMPTNLSQERKRLNNTVHNRYHFIKMRIPQCWSDLQANGIKTDASLGFPYKMGFRNSFGLPFKPFCLHRQREIDILEIPFHIMDGMFDIIDKNTSDIAFDDIVNFIESNNTDALLSILWHNSEMTEYAYKSSFKCYKRLLSYFYESKYETVLPSQLLVELE